MSCWRGATNFGILDDGGEVLREVEVVELVEQRVAQEQLPADAVELGRAEQAERARRAAREADRRTRACDTQVMTCGTYLQQ